MRILQVDQNSDEWLEARKGKITGSKAYDTLPKYRGAGFKSGFYKLIAERLAANEEITNHRERGHNLEEAAAEEFERQCPGKKLMSVGMVVSDFDEDIALSPDKFVVPEKENEFTEAVEIKCLSSELHIEAVMENHIPGKDANKYMHQILHYFVVVPTLETVYLTFYDPRLSVYQLYVIPFYRKDLEKEIEELKDQEIETLKRVREALTRLAF